MNQLAALPGFGRYTVNAVLSQAYNQRLPIVDANVARILCRLFAWKEKLQSKETKDWLWSMADALLPEDHIGDFNQAWMELGQTICTTGKPKCLLCPLKSVCRGRHEADRLPVRAAQPVISYQYERAIVVKKGEHILLVQRPAHAHRWANMWEFPTLKMSKPNNQLRTVNQQSRLLTGYSVHEPAKLGTHRYSVTRFRVILEIVQASYRSGKAHHRCYQQMKWLTYEQLRQYPLSVPHRQIAKQFLSRE
jgi:A/G-specific adenine glycosylase